MDADDKRKVLADHLAEFRDWSYATLAAEIDRTRKTHDCLRRTEGVFDDGTEYQLEFNVFWDGKRGSDIRVCGDIATEPQRRLLRMLPIYLPDVTASFIMAPDGSCVGE